MVKIKCLNCNKEKKVRQSDLNRGQGKFCGLKCSSQYNGQARAKYTTLTKVCPVCNSIFDTTNSPKEEKTTCSSSCANTHFRTGKDHYSHGKEPKGYRLIALSIYPHKCAVCEESLVIEIHHLDEDKSNNNVENLVPLCPTHHMYMHHGYKDLIIDQIEEYIKEILV